jgi:hypothetical protein
MDVFDRRNSCGVEPSAADVTNPTRSGMRAMYAIAPLRTEPCAM